MTNLTILPLEQAVLMRTKPKNVLEMFKFKFHESSPLLKCKPESGGHYYRQAGSVNFPKKKLSLSRQCGSVAIIIAKQAVSSYLTILPLLRSFILPAESGRSQGGSGKSF